MLEKKMRKTLSQHRPCITFHVQNTPYTILSDSYVQNKAYSFCFQDFHITFFKNLS